MEGWSALPSGSHHEELADGGCSCSQVGKQVGDWLTFPLDQANLIGEFTAGPFHIGSLSDWVATEAKGSHFSPCAVSSLCLFSPSFEPELCSWTCLCCKSKIESKHNLTCMYCGLTVISILHSKITYYFGTFFTAVMMIMNDSCNVIQTAIFSFNNRTNGIRALHAKTCV